MKILPMMAFVVVTAFAMTTMTPTSFAQGKGKGNADGRSTNQEARVESRGSGRAYGHFIAPGWLRKYEAPSSEGLTLPHGIMKKLCEGGSPSHYDVGAPRISAVVVSETDTTATITWNTNEPAKSAVYVSTSSPVDLNGVSTLTVTNDNLVTVHSALFTGLSPSTTYYVRIKVTDDSGNTRIGGKFTFTTDIAPDTMVPVITNVVTNIGTTTATTSWTTNEPATTVGYISTTTGFGVADLGVVKVQNVNLVTGHSISFDGLTASTTYFIRIESVDAGANATLSNEMSLTTL